MARRRKAAAMVCPPGGSCGPKCIIMMLLAAVFGALGLWMIVGGVMKQLSGAVPWTSVAMWYAGGFILWCFAKCFKWKACAKHQSMNPPA